MSQVASAGLKGALDRAIGVVRHTTVRQAWFELGWQWLTALAAFLVLDLLFGLPVWMRWIGLLSIVAFPIYAIFDLRRRSRGHVVAEDQAARLVEEGHPELDNALINAVQFGRVLESSPGMQGDLMRREIERAEQAAARTPIEDSIDRSGEKKAFRLFVGTGIAWVVGTVAFSGVVFTILPRMFAPWMDDVTPPFSLTKISLNPPGSTVRYGGSLVVSVGLKGPYPEQITLGTSSNKRDWRNLQLESTEPGKYALTLTDLREDTWIVAQGGGARSSRYLVHVVKPPIAESMQATYTYPGYTKRKEFTESVGKRGIHGLRDTKVALQIEANRELTGGELVVETDEGKASSFILQVDKSNPKRAVASFPITGPGKFRIALASDDSQVNSDAAQGKITLERDQHPNVWFNEPPSEIVVTPNMLVALGIEADDDIGVQKLDLHRVINGIADDNSSVYQGTALRKVDGQVVMDLADLGLRPGDEITYYAEAFDNDPGQPNYAQSESQKIRVISEEEYQELLKQQRDEKRLAEEIRNIEDAIGSLAERQQELAEKMDKLQKQLAKDPNNAALKEQLEQAKAEEKKLQAEARALADKLKKYAQSPSSSEIEKAIKQKVAEAAKRLENTANKAMDAAAKNPNPQEAARAAQQAAQEMGKNAEQAKKEVGESIKNVEKAAPLFNDVERFKQLLDRQGQVVLQARQFQESSPNDPAAKSKMEALQEEQKRIGEELKQLQDDFRRHADEAQKDFPKAAESARKIAEEIGKREIPSIMDQAQGNYEQEQGAQGFANSQKALEEMEAMMQKAGECQSKGKGELDIKLQDSLGKSGLGQSLGDCLNPGMGQGQGRGNGSGSGTGAGGSMGGSSGTSGARQSSQNGPIAYTMNMKSPSGKLGVKRSNAPRPEGDPASLSPDSIEKLPSGDRKPPKATDAAAKGYPAEYKKMIKDYFVSVTKERKK